MFSRNAAIDGMRRSSNACRTLEPSAHPLALDRVILHQQHARGRVITSLDLDAKDRERLNAGVRFVLVKERFQPADLVERIRRLVHSKPPALSGMEAAS
jgi:hypothetical protein